MGQIVGAIMGGFSEMAKEKAAERERNQRIQFEAEKARISPFLKGLGVKGIGELPEKRGGGDIAGGAITGAIAGGALEDSLRKNSVSEDVQASTRESLFDSGVTTTGDVVSPRAATSSNPTAI
jgi:hypothetical protein